MRLDRAVTMFIYDRVRRPDRNHCAIPILMYHSISDQDDLNRYDYYRTNTRPDVFTAHMEFLKNSGYSVIDLADVMRCSEHCGNQVAITFDDGYRDFYDHAAPVLARFGFKATVFLPTAYIGNKPRGFNQRDCLTWNEVRELTRSGVSFGSHTVTHPQLLSVNRRQIRCELSESKECIEQQLGITVDRFAYPFAFPEAAAEFKRYLRTVLDECGYKVGVCTTVGRVRKDLDPLFLWRLPMNSSDDLRLFHAKLSGAYDWIRRPQEWLKRAKRRFG